MKRRIRLFAILCVAVMSLAMLSSCSYIDELKEQRFVWADEEHEKIEYKGNEYIKLENKSDFEINSNSFESNGYVVEEDLPLLLMSLTYSECSYDKKYDLIYFEGTIYCQADKHDEYSKILQKGVLDHYKIDYSYYDYEEYEYKGIFTILDEDTTELINGTLDTVVGRELSTDIYYDYYDMQILSLDKCDATGFIHSVDVLDLYRDVENDTCGIMAYDHDAGSYIAWEFPDEHENIIEKLFDECYMDYSFDEMADEYYSY